MQYFQNKAQPVLENDDFRMYYNRSFLTDSKLLNKIDNKVFLTDPTCQNSHNLLNEHQEKQVKYADIAIEIKPVECG